MLILPLSNSNWNESAWKNLKFPLKKRKSLEKKPKFQCVTRIIPVHFHTFPFFGWFFWDRLLVGLPLPGRARLWPHPSAHFGAARAGEWPRTSGFFPGNFGWRGPRGWFRWGLMVDGWANPLDVDGWELLDVVGWCWWFGLAYLIDVARMFQVGFSARSRGCPVQADYGDIRQGLETAFDGFDMIYQRMNSHWVVFISIWDHQEDFV